VTPKQIDVLVKAVEEDTRKLVKEYFDARINEDLDEVKLYLTELYKSVVKVAENHNTLTAEMLALTELVTSLATKLDEPTGATNGTDDEPL